MWQSEGIRSETLFRGETVWVTDASPAPRDVYYVAQKGARLSLAPRTFGWYGCVCPP
jgi:hypothetical protein